LRPFITQVLVTLALVALAWLLWQLSGMLLLVFGAVVVAVALRALAAWVMRYTPLHEGLALAMVVLFLLACVGLLLWLFGSQLAAQFETLRQTLPAA
jgi:predicted PurR-regulated permease PerM